MTAMTNHSMRMFANHTILEGTYLRIVRMNSQLYLPIFERNFA